MRHKALTLLVHPVSWMGLFILLLNDHWLRRAYPSWVTGKLGDFAWLVWTPFVAALLIALLAPRLAEKEVKLWAFASTAGVFVAGKLSPAVAAWMAGGLAATFGGHFQILADPTDLIALSALALSWRVWDTPSVRLPRLDPRWGWASLSLAALLTVANSAMPDYGITCISRGENNVLMAFSSYYTFESSDGGITWGSLDHPDQTYGCAKEVAPTSITDLSGETTYRFAPGQPIERSRDGQTWEVAYGDVSGQYSAERAYFEKTNPSTSGSNPGPNWAIIDAPTGNIVFSMGLEGVLVLQPDGTWVWSEVGIYRKTEVNRAEMLFTLLVGELLLALAAGLILLGVLSLRLSRRWWKIALLALAALAVLLTFVLAPPAITNQSYSDMIAQGGVIAALALSILLGLIAIVEFARNSQAWLGRGLGLALLAAVLPFLPFVLWALGAIPNYWLALAFAGLLYLSVLLPATLRRPSQSA